MHKCKDMDEATRSGARSALLNARSPIIQDYLIEELARAPEDYDLNAAYAEVMDEAGARIRLKTMSLDSVIVQIFLGRVCWI